VSGEMAQNALSSGLTALGLNVTLVGVAPTPTVLHAASAYDADGCLTITASHNPAEWNGVEFALKRGQLMSGDDRARFQQLVESGAPSLAPWDAVGEINQRHDAIELHLARILALSSVNLTAIERRGLRIVVDSVNGAGSVISPSLLSRLGVETIPLYCEPTGRFPRSPEPSDESLAALKETVLRENADLGFAHDADADRLVFVNERGEFVPEEYTFAFVADVLLKRDKRPLITTVVTGALLDDVAAKHGVKVVRTPVGVGYVVEKMRELGASVGGESTGGVVIPGTHLTTDGIAAIAVIVSGLASFEGTMSEWVGRWNEYHLLRTKLPLASRDQIDAALEHAATMYPDAVVERMDGVKIVLNDGWIVVRPSGTEPVLRVFAESVSRERAELLLTRTRDAMKQFVGA
ncbi:MAG: phosphoglucosamine mutase, partial [Candidatus Poribacteria bacterium]|nr:phosphoglucosamine mutase [Candidatus Poribacteria bacterium]